PPCLCITHLSAPLFPYTTLFRSCVNSLNSRKRISKTRWSISCDLPLTHTKIPARCYSKNPTFIPNKKEAFKLPYCFLFEKLEKLHYLMLPQHSRNQYYSYLAIPLDDYLNTPITKSTFLYAYEHLQHFLLHLEPKCL